MNSFNSNLASLKDQGNEAAESIDSLHGFLGDVSSKLDIHHQEVCTKMKSESKRLDSLRDSVSKYRTEAKDAISVSKESKVILVL